MTHDRQDDHRGMSRRQMIAGAGAIAGAAWVAPAVLSVDAAAAASTLATVTLGAATRVNGNNTVTVPLPTGTFTKYILIVAEEFGSSPYQAGPLPSIISGSFTPVTSTTAAPPPSFGVYESSSTTPGTLSLKGNDTNGQWAAVVLGFTTGSTVTVTAIASSSASPISVAGGTAAINSTWVLVGSAAIGTGTANWATPAGYTKLLDTSGTSNAQPDLFVARYNTLGLTVPAQPSLAFGAGDTAKAIQIGVG